MAVREPQAIGMVLAMIVDPKGKPVRDGSAKGQLYASRDEICVVRPPARDELLGRLAIALLLGSVAAVVVNLFTWKSTAVLWVAIGAQLVYWVTLPARRRAMEPLPLGEEALEAARRAGRVAIQVPAQAVLRAVAPEPPRTGLRKPARFELPDGALEIYLSQEQFAEIARAIGRAE